MTVLLTGLIWATADSLVNEAVSVNVTFDVVPAAGANDLHITTTAGAEPFELQISGPRRIVESVLQHAPFRVRLPVSDRPKNGPDRVWLERAMLKRVLSEQFNEFRKLTIASVEPDTLPVSVDHWVTREVRLVLGRLTLDYDVEPQISRTRTTVRMRASRLSEFSNDQPLQLDLSSEVERLLRDQPPGKRVRIPLTLDSRVFGPEAEFKPDRVEVTATLKAQRRTARIPTVPILVAVSFANLPKPFAAVTRNGDPLTLVTQTITVTGPTEEVNRLESGATRAYGIVHLKEVDLEQLGTLKLMTPEYHLPPGIELAEDPPPIQLKLINTRTNENKPG